MKAQRESTGLGRRSAVAVFVAVGALALLPLGGATLVGHSGTTATVAPSAGPCKTGAGPYRPAYDPVRHLVYVPNAGSGNITVLKSTCTLAGTITLPVGASPIAAAFDPSDNEVYVTDDSLNHVYVLSGTALVATISNSLLPSPWAILYDPGDSMILVSNDYGNYSVVGIQGTSVLGAVGVGSYPIDMCYDPFFNTILVVNYFSYNVTILSAYNPLSGATGSGGTGADPTSCAYSPATSADYVVNYANNNVSVMAGTGSTYATITVGSLPRTVVWDQATLQIMVGNSLKGGVSVISGYSVVKTIKGVAPNCEGMVYDEQNNFVYVTSYTGNDAVIVT